MDLDNCKQCGKVFIVQQARQTRCKDCKTEYDELYRKVRDFIRLKPGLTVLELHRETGIPMRALLELRREDYVPYSY